VGAVEAIECDFVSNAKLGAAAHWTGADPEHLLAATVSLIRLPNRELYRPVQFSSQVQLLCSNEKQFRGVFKARRLLYHSTLGRE
jgi:hypothetical protein